MLFLKGTQFFQLQCCDNYLESFSWKLETYFMKYTFQLTEALSDNSIKIKRIEVVLETKLSEIAFVILFHRKIKFLDFWLSIGYRIYIYIYIYIFLCNHSK